MDSGIFDCDSRQDSRQDNSWEPVWNKDDNVEEINEPLVLVSFANGEIHFDEKVARHTIDNPLYKSKKKRFVSTMGASRCGKSFLMTYLSNGIKNGEIRGVFESGFRRQTEGILIFPQPYIVDDKAIFFLDTQGLFDLETNRNVSAQIAAYSLLLSDLQIINLGSVLSSDQLETLQFFVDSIASFQETLLPKGLLFVLRNFPNWREVNYIENVWKGSESSEVLKKCTRGLRDRFSDRITSICVPTPSLDVVKANGVAKVTNEDKDFFGQLEKVKAFIEQFFTDDSEVIDRNAEEIIALADAMTNFLQRDAPQLKPVAVIVEEREILFAVNRTFDRFLAIIKNSTAETIEFYQDLATQEVQGNLRELLKNKNAIEQAQAMLGPKREQAIQEKRRYFEALAIEKATEKNIEEFSDEWKTRIAKLNDLSNAVELKEKLGMESDSLKIPDSTKHVLEARLDNRIASLTVGYAAREKDEIERGFAEFLRQNQKSIDEDLLDQRISQQMERLRESCRTNAINDDYLVEIVEDVGLALQEMKRNALNDLEMSKSRPMLPNALPPLKTLKPTPSVPADAQVINPEPSMRPIADSSRMPVLRPNVPLSTAESSLPVMPYRPKPNDQPTFTSNPNLSMRKNLAQPPTKQQQNNNKTRPKPVRPEEQLNQNSTWTTVQPQAIVFPPTASRAVVKRSFGAVERTRLNSYPSPNQNSLLRNGFTTTAFTSSKPPYTTQPNPISTSSSLTRLNGNGNAERLMQTFRVPPEEIEATMSALQSYKLWQDLQPNLHGVLKKCFGLTPLRNWDPQSIDAKRLEENIIERLREDPSAAALWTPQKWFLFVDKPIAVIKEIERQLSQTRSDIDLQTLLNDALFNTYRIDFKKLAATRRPREEILPVFNNQIPPASMPMIPMALQSFQLAVILMNTQGTFDTSSNMNDSATIFAISLLMSSVKIFNTKTQIDAQGLDALNTFISFSQLSNDKIRQHFLIMVRDALYKGHRNDYLEELKTQASRTKELQNPLNGVFDAFDKVDCYMIPRPLLAVTEANGEILAKDCSEQFLDTLCECANYELDNLEPKVVMGTPLTGRTLKAHVEANVVFFFMCSDKPAAFTKMTRDNPTGKMLASPDNHLERIHQETIIPA